MAAIDTPARGFCVGGGFFIARGILSNGTHGEVGSRSDPAPRDSSSPVSSLLTVIEWYFSNSPVSGKVREIKTRLTQRSCSCHEMTCQETPSMRSRRGLAFRPSLAVSVRLECLEDRRLLSALGGSSGAEDLPTGNSSQLVGDSAVVMSVNASQANASGTDSPGDWSVSVVNVVYAAANDGELSGAQAQGTASSSDFAGPTSAPGASTVSDLGETTASPSAELAQTTPTAASAPLASKGTTSGLGVTAPSPSAPLPQTTSTAVVNRGSGIGSSSAAQQTPGNEATTNLSSGTSSSRQAELTPADEGVSAASASGSVPDALIS